MNLLEKIGLFNKLTVDTKPLWGKMNSKQMVEHLVWTLKTSNGKITLDTPFYPKKKSDLAKKILFGNKPLPPNFSNPIAASVIDIELSKNLEGAIKLLKEELTDYYKHYELNPDSISLHIVFGELNKNEWDLFHEKHFDHHLRQFGII